MTVTNLIKKFNDYQVNNTNTPTLEEMQFLCENEEHEAFFFDYYLFRDIMDFRDHLEIEKGA
jgi:hypothetical protein